MNKDKVALLVEPKDARLPGPLCRARVRHVPVVDGLFDGPSGSLISDP